LTNKLFKILCFLVLLSVSVFADSMTDRLEAELPSSQGIVRINLLNKLAYLEHRISYDKSLSYSKQALQLAQKTGYKKGEAAALQNLGFCYYLRNNTDDAVTCLDNSLKISIYLNDQYLIASANNYFGLVYWKLNDFPKAFNYFRHALSIAKSVNYKTEMSKSLNYMGLIYWKWSDYYNSMNYFLKSLELKESLKDNYEIVVTLNNIAKIYNEMGKYDLAIRYSNKALAISDSVKDKYGLARAYNNLGESYYSLKDYRKAEDAQKFSLSLRKASGDKNGTSYSYINLGNIYFDLGDYSKALNYFQNALSIKKEVNDNEGISEVFLAMSEVYIRLNQYNKAGEVLEKSVSIAEQKNFKKILVRSYLAMSSFMEKQGNTAEALKYLKLYSNEKDSVFTKENFQKISELQATYENAAKEKEIDMLNKARKIQALELEEQNTGIIILFFIIVIVITLSIAIARRYSLTKKTKEILEEKNKVINKHQIDLIEANITKDKFFSIVAHDLKSPFTGLLGYSEMLKNDIDELSKEELKPIAENIYSITKNILNHIESLLTWSRTQIGRMDFKPESINLYNECQDIFGLIRANAINKNITLLNKVSPEIFVIADNNMLRSILQNIISNGIKFTNKDGIISVSSKIINDHIKISVEDNGIGMSPEILSKLFRLDYKITTPGTSAEIGTGLGLLLCKELVEKNGGQISVESKPGEGTNFIFTLKKA
jgi:signal transduction histidine kinase/Tfp pilus assembly protein PilF